MSLPTNAYKLRYFALTILLSGSFVASPLTVTWLSNNIPQPGKRAIVLGINGWGNFAGVISSMLFAPKFEKGGYLIPFYVTLACVLTAFIGYLAFRAAGWAGLALVFVAALVVGGQGQPESLLRFVTLGIVVLLAVIWLGNRRDAAAR